ncbi:hypothetical protein Tco_0158079 [Tanacetum coccineum]
MCVFFLIGGRSLEKEGVGVKEEERYEKMMKPRSKVENVMKTVSTPMDTSEKLMPNNVGKQSRYTSNPGTQHQQVIQRVLKYLKKTMDNILTYTGCPLVLEGYTDASWISNTKDNSFTSGWVFMLGGGVISWASKKQT